MIEIKLKDKSSVEKKELVELLKYQRKVDLERNLSVEEIKKEEKRGEWLLTKYLTMNFLAYENDELVGWLGVCKAFPPTNLIWEYHPIIKSSDNKQQIARELFMKCFEYAIKEKIANTRTFIDVPENKKKRYQEIKEYFLDAGMKQTHTVLCMENKVTKDKLKGVVIDSDYKVEKAGAQTLEALTECYNQIFAKSFDNFTSSLDKEERKYWNVVSGRNFTDASFVIKKDEKVVGIILAVDYGDFMELGPIGVVPEHRGKKLGNVLMEICLEKLIEMEKTDSYLEVDKTNTPAISLYEKFGFKEVSKKHGFLYREYPEENFKKNR